MAGATTAPLNRGQDRHDVTLDVRCNGPDPLAGAIRAASDPRRDEVPSAFIAAGNFNAVPDDPDVPPARAGTGLADWQHLCLRSGKPTPLRRPHISATTRQPIDIYSGKRASSSIR
jgi:hypothetical protein